jgi:hypothetical protein
MNYILGNYIGFDESKFNEFKEFSLKFDPIKYLDIESIKEIVETGVVGDDFNEIIMMNIDHYFKFYLPKYISAFGNVRPEDETDILPETASFYIGVNDFGEITGIPFIGEIDKDHINEMIKSIKIFMQVENIDELLSMIKIEVIELKKDLKYIEDPLEEILSKHSEKNLEIKKMYKDYFEKQIEWISLIEKYTIKMATYLNDVSYRNKIADYIRSKTSDPEYLNIADQLNGTYKFTLLSGIEIMEEKNNQLNVYHWLTSYKDDTIDYIKQIRPSRPQVSHKSNHEMFEYQFIKLTHLRKRFIASNKDIKYYILKINIPVNYKKEISFCNAGSTRVITKIRDVINGRPCCING